MIDKGSVTEKLLEACFALDAIGEKAINDIRTWFVEHMLAPYIELFSPGKQEAGFQNTKRRFAWYKRVMKEARQPKNGESCALFDIFPEQWQMAQLYTYEFCRMTKLHIDETLSTQ
jgi:Vps53-like, N-terminal